MLKVTNLNTTTTNLTTNKCIEYVPMWCWEEEWRGKDKKREKEEGGEVR